jgi:maltooligosyltrehalose trehalohydrolase
LFESRAGASEDLRAGRLRGPATVAFLDPAAKGGG